VLDPAAAIDSITVSLSLTGQTAIALSRAA